MRNKNIEAVPNNSVIIAILKIIKRKRMTIKLRIISQLAFSTLQCTIIKSYKHKTLTEDSRATQYLKLQLLDKKKIAISLLSAKKMQI